MIVATRIATMVLAILLQRSVIGFTPKYVSCTLFSRCMSTQSSALKSTEVSSSDDNVELVPLYRAEGVFAVNKPVDWTSSDVVSYIRGILERDARNRGANPEKLGRRKSNRTIKVGHGGTLDPLATGVLVVGVGSATKQLQRCVCLDENRIMVECLF